MSLLEILILIVLAFSAYAALILLRKKRLSYLLQKLTKYDRDFKVALEDFHKLFQNNWYISDWQYQSWKTKYEYLAKIANPDIAYCIISLFAHRFPTKEEFHIRYQSKSPKNHLKE